VVRVSDGVVLGTTPETIVLRSSKLSLLLRLEKEGYASTTKEVSLASDINFAAVLEPLPVKTPPPPPTRRKYTPRNTRTVPELSEPAKL